MSYFQTGFVEAVLNMIQFERMMYPVGRDPVARFYHDVKYGRVTNVYPKGWGGPSLCECLPGTDRSKGPYWKVWHRGEKGWNLRLALDLGIVKPARGQICVDCGRAATVLEHRHSLRPLDVEPTCHRCNLRRGPPDDLNDGTRSRMGKSIPRKPNGHVRYAFRDSMLEATTEPLD